MTTFDKQVKRRTIGAYAVLYRKPKKIVVTLARGDLIKFRPCWQRREWCLPVEAAFKYAIQKASMGELFETKGGRQ